jgi:molybdopterin-guanine dinucleotide biosynthesis protein A
MGKDKGALVYRDGLDQRTRCYSLLGEVCDSVWISCRSEQVPLIPTNLPCIVDAAVGHGPGVGILSAFTRDPGAAWLILACDFPNADLKTIHHLVSSRDPSKAATVFVNADGFLEPLFAIWETDAMGELARRFKGGSFSPREALESLVIARITPPTAAALENVNEPVGRSALG